MPRGRLEAARRIAFEALESRCLLSVGLGAIANVALPAGKAMFIPLAGGAEPGHTLNFAATVSDLLKLTPVRSCRATETCNST